MPVNVTKLLLFILADAILVTGNDKVPENVVVFVDWLKDKFVDLKATSPISYTTELNVNFWFPVILTLVKLILLVDESSNSIVFAGLLMCHF